MLDHHVEEEEEEEKVPDEENPKPELSVFSSNSVKRKREIDSLFMKLVWIPQFLLILSTLAFMLLKTKSFSFYTPFIQNFYGELVFM